MDRNVSNSLRKSHKYLGRTIFILFLGFLSLQTIFEQFFIDHGLIVVIVYIFLVFLAIMLVISTLMISIAQDYESKVKQGIKYLNDIKSLLGKIRINICLSDKELARKTKLKASIDRFDIDLKSEHISAVQELRNQLVEKEKRLQSKLMKGHEFPKPPRSYIFWRNRVLRIPSMSDKLMSTALYKEKI